MGTPETTRRRAAAIVVAGVGVLGGLLGVLPECSSSGARGGASDAGGTDTGTHDAGSDVGLVEEADDEDGDAGVAPPTCLAAFDASVWPGWQSQSQANALSPCCPWATPVDAAAVVPPYAWVPCSNGATNCLDLQTTWVPEGGTADFGGASASRDGQGNPRRLMLTRVVGAYGAPPFEEDLYDIEAGTIVGGWRGDDTLATRPYCYVEALLGQNTVTVDEWFPSKGFYVASGTPAAMQADPNLQRFDDAITSVQETMASDRVFAFDLEPQGVIGRTEIGSGTVQQAKGSVGLFLCMVEGDDVFACSEHGSAGWGQLYEVDAAGTLTLLRSNPNAHVATPASDGTRIYWTETYGTMDVQGTQTTTEFWSAPYTADPATLAATASRYAVVPNPQLPITSIAFGGLMAITNRNNTVFIARQSDGTVIQPPPGPDRFYSGLVAVTPTELWVTEGVPGGPAGSSLTRLGLGAW